MSKSEVKVKIGVDIALAGEDRTEKLYIIGKKKMKEFDAYKATGLTPNQIQEMDKLYSEKCRELAELKRNMPPCEIGDSIWEIDDSEIYEYTVTGFRLGRMINESIEDMGAGYERQCREWRIEMESVDSNASIYYSQIGKTLFFSCEAAERKLAEKENNHE